MKDSKVKSADSKPDEIILSIDQVGLANIEPINEMSGGAMAGTSRLSQAAISRDDTFHCAKRSTDDRRMIIQIKQSAAS